MPAGRKLKKDDPDLFDQRLEVVKKMGHRFFGVFEFFHMGDISAGLDGKEEVFRNRMVPGFKGLEGGESIEGIVDLYGTKMFFIIVQKCFIGELFGVKRTPPMLIVPSGGADVYHRFFFIFFLPASTLGYSQSVVAKRDLRAPIIRDALNLIIHKIKRLILLPCKLGSDS